MSKLKLIQEKIEQNQAALRDILAKRSADGTFPADVQEQIKRANADLIALKEQGEIERIAEGMENERILQEANQRAAANASGTGAPKPGATTSTSTQTYDSVFWRHMMRYDSAQPAGNLNEDERRLLETRGTATQITTSNTLGGYLVPQQFSNELERMRKWYAQMSDYCRVLDDTSMGGGTLEWPCLDDTASVGNINTAANQAATRTVADLTFGHLTFGDWLVDSNIIKVSRSLIQDERVGLLQDELANILAERIGRKTNSVWTNGTGTNEPYGLTGSGISTAITTAGATAIIVSELIRAQASIDYAYARNPKSGWMMHQTVLAYLRTLDFSTSTSHIFIPGNIATGEPDMLLGWPVRINNDLPAVTGATGLPVTATKHIYFGDFSKFAIRNIRNLAIERNDYIYWEQLSVGFMGWLRTDSRLLNANAIKCILQA